MHKIRAFPAYKYRYTLVDYEDERYHLACESGVFLLYSLDGKLVARAFKTPFVGRRIKSLSVDSLRLDDKFDIVRVNENLLGVRELITGVIHDYMVLEGVDSDAFNEALFIFVSRVLMETGYDKNASVGYSGLYDLSKRSIVLGDDVVIRIENMCIIYSWKRLKNVVNHVYSIMKDLSVNQYCDINL